MFIDLLLNGFHRQYLVINKKRRISQRKSSNLHNILQYLI